MPREEGRLYDLSAPSVPSLPESNLLDMNSLSACCREGGKKHAMSHLWAGSRNYEITHVCPIAGAKHSGGAVLFVALRLCAKAGH